MIRRAARDAAWWVADYAYAATWQARAFLNRTDPATFRSGPEVALVLLPGVYETWKFLQPLASALHERGHPIHIVDVLHRNSRPVTEMAVHVTRYLDDHDLTDVMLVAHSKGGLVGKQVMIGEAGSRVRGMVAVATPFGGSRYARMMLSPTLRSFSPRDRTIVALAQQLEVNARITSVYGLFDPHIPEGSKLPGGRNVQLETGGHFRILAHPRVIAEVERMSAAA
ncbi:esterase/lipase family protein [Microbacterium lushaniae]|uniref:esterase/lipase family protein n=1 Tax=Microbacterium lushaniae TaxID=2614639 RepID=UPI001EE93BC9|nr:alpha/beta hydrolase [Microbacterium lushaniae]